MNTGVADKTWRGAVNTWTVDKPPPSAWAFLLPASSPLAGRWIPDETVRFGYGAVLTVAYGAFSMYARRHDGLRRFFELGLAFFVLAFVQLLNNSVPGFVATYLLHDPPNAGDPLASTVTPHLWRLAREGVWCERSHAVYTSLTRPNSPAISTGCTRAAASSMASGMPSTRRQIQW